MLIPLIRTSLSPSFHSYTVDRMVGHETTAGSISFTLDALARNPAYQDRLRDEIMRHRDEAGDGAFGYDALMDSATMPYLDAVVKEGCVPRSNLLM